MPVLADLMSVEEALVCLVLQALRDDIAVTFALTLKAEQQSRLSRLLGTSLQHFV